jgi:hypothetical protein
MQAPSQKYSSDMKGFVNKAKESISNMAKSNSDSKSNNKVSVKSLSGNIAKPDTIPTLSEDALDYSQYAEAISEFILNPDTKTPITIAITGEWGSGKSTLMSWIKEYLEANNTKTVWYNAWKHPSKEALWAGFFQEIFNQSQKKQRYFKFLVWLERAKAYDIKAGLVISVLISLLAGIFVYFIFSFDNSLINMDVFGSFSSKSNIFAFSGLFSFVFAIVFFIKTSPVIHTPINNITKLGDGPDYKNKIGFQGLFENDLNIILKIRFIRKICG